jgi:ribonuclease Z
MSQILQLIKNPRLAKLKKSRSSKLLKNPQKRSVCIKVLTLSPKKPLSYAYCSDTAFHPPIIDLITNVDLLYHESTFLNEHKELALKTLHSTAEQAAKIASLANVGKLILGHFSTRYKDKQIFIKEAKIQFENVVLAEQGQTYKF